MIFISRTTCTNTITIIDPHTLQQTINIIIITSTNFRPPHLHQQTQNQWLLVNLWWKSQLSPPILLLRECTSIKINHIITQLQIITILFENSTRQRHQPRINLNFLPLSKKYLHGIFTILTRNTGLLISPVRSMFFSFNFDDMHNPIFHGARPLYH